MKKTLKPKKPVAGIKKNGSIAKPSKPSVAMTGGGPRKKGYA